jgi:hypothetical protein
MSPYELSESEMSIFKNTVIVPKWIVRARNIIMILGHSLL